METKTARRKAFDVEYVVVSEDNLKDVADWCHGAVGGEEEDRFIRILDKNAMNTRQTKAFIGDYILKYGNSFKSFGRKAFHKSFDELSEEHKVSRSAKTGKFVSHEDAEKFPDETVTERVMTTQRGTGRPPIDTDEQEPPYWEVEDDTTYYYTGEGGSITREEYDALYEEIYGRTRDNPFGDKK